MTTQFSKCGLFKLETGVLYALNNKTWRIIYHPAPNTTSVDDAVCQYQDWFLYQDDGIWY